MTHITTACPQQLTLPKKYHIPKALLAKEPVLDFAAVTPESMSLIWPYLQLENSRTCDFSYGGIIMWEPLFNYQYAIYNDTLFIKGKLEGDLSSSAFSLPLGNLPIGECISLLRDWCDHNGEQLRFSAIPQSAVGSFSKHEPAAIKELPDWADYLYDIIPLATLQGKKMAKKRNHFNKFQSEYPDHRFSPLSRENIRDAFEVLLSTGSEIADTSEMAMTEHNLSLNTLRLFGSTNSPMLGGVLYANDKPVAFTMGDVKGDTLYVHIEKADRSVHGSYEAINKCFAAYMLSRFPELKYVNREDDAGDPGLRKAKASYHPIALLKKYDILF